MLAAVVLRGLIGVAAGTVLGGHHPGDRYLVFLGAVLVVGPLILLVVFLADIRIGFLGLVTVEAGDVG